MEAEKQQDHPDRQHTSVCRWWSCGHGSPHSTEEGNSCCRAQDFSMPDLVDLNLFTNDPICVTTRNEFALLINIFFHADYALSPLNQLEEMTG